MSAGALFLLAAVLLSVLSLGIGRDIPRSGERTPSAGQSPVAAKTPPQLGDSRRTPISAAAVPASQRSPPVNETAPVVVLVMPAGANASSFNDDDADLPRSNNKHRLIRGSKEAATITKTEYLKKDWCQTEPFQQIIHEQGCRRKRIMNKFCYGQCNSFFIPKSDGEDQDGGSFRSCAYCTPVNSEWVDVVLSCPYRSPPRLVKQVQIVTQCKCMAVNLDLMVLLA